MFSSTGVLVTEVAVSPAVSTAQLKGTVETAMPQHSDRESVQEIASAANGGRGAGRGTNFSSQPRG